ncbi:MAG: SpoIIE family protein phosphatase [Deltaproteobacteria bacterium]|nr:SpoIIE family protein phosphatase [Deltaproteobacteria bacterium]
MTIAVSIVVGVAVFLAGLLLASRRRQQRAADAALASTEREAAMWQFIERSLQSWSSDAVCQSLGDALSAGLGMGTIVLLEPGEQGWQARRLDGPARPPPAQNVFAWFRHNPDLVLVSELADGRFGGMRLPLEELAREYGADALLPLAHREQLFGVVACGGRGRPLDRGERNFLRQLHLEGAAIAANARLYTEAALKLSLQHEVGAASAVQQALLPRTGSQRLGGVTVACHYRGTPDGASDVFAAFEHEGRVTLVVGDIVGRGVAASMLAAVAKGCCDAAIGADVGDLLRVLNGAIYRPGRCRPEMRCLAATIDPAAGAVRVASAGAPFPCLVSGQPGNTRIRSVLARGPLLGDQPQASFPVVTEKLDADDALVMFAPGLILAESAGRRPYGERRLLNALRQAAASTPASLVDTLAADLDRFVAGHTSRDEILLVVARAEGPGGAGTARAGEPSPSAKV